MAASGNFPLTPVHFPLDSYDTLRVDHTPTKDDIPSTLTDTHTDLPSISDTLPGQATPINFTTMTSGGASVQDQVSDPFDVFGENNLKEKDILRMNRVKLIEYIHDCKVLFPYMKQNTVFSMHECEIIQHEVTGKQRMDKFIDIVLTKGPEAIGVFHESLRKDYPFVFDVLTRLFSSANIDLPPSRQLREDPENKLEASVVTERSDLVSSFRRSTRTHDARQTIRRKMDELHERCEQVRSQRDDLQQALIQRERDINALLSHRDQQIQQKYEDMLTLLAKWRETMTNQSDGSIQKMQELLSEQEGIKEAYEQLEGEYMLVETELSAARDRIAKLLAHLEKMETEFALAQEERDSLLDKISEQEGVIERRERRYKRMTPADPREVSSAADTEKHATPTELSNDIRSQLMAAQEDRQDCERMLEVAKTERKQAINENQDLRLQLYGEKEKNKKLEEEVRRLRGGRMDRIISCPGPGPCEEVPWVGSVGGVAPGGGGAAGKVVPMVDETIVMPADSIGMELGVAVTVRDLIEGGNAVKAGVRLGDEICQVNHIKVVSMDTESLKFTQRLLQQAYSTITLSIKRQIPGNAANPSPSHLGSGGVTATHPLVSPSGHMSYNFNPHSIMGAHNVEIDGGRGGVSGSGREKRIRPPNLIPISKKKFSTVSQVLETRDTSDSTSEGSCQDIREDHFPEKEYHHPATSSSQNQFQEEGIITSPTIESVGCLHELKKVLHCKLPADDSRLSLPQLDSPLDGYPYDSDSTDQHLSLEDAPPSTPRRINHQRKVVRNRRHAKKKEADLHGNKRLSKSLDDLDIVEAMLNSNSSRPSSRGDSLRQVILPFGQLGSGLSIIGGRGNGLYICSERHTERSLKTGDQIIQICGKSALKMTYGEAMDLMSKYNSRGRESVLTVKTNKEGYSKLHLFSRDNFYVRAKISHKSRSRLELSFDVGDTFHVTDTKPKEQGGAWQVEKLNSRGQTIATGYIPTSIESSAIMMSMGSSSMPRLIKPSMVPLIDKSTTMGVKQSPGTTMTTIQSAFKLYQPVKELRVLEPRPVVLFGVYESELRDSLITNFRRTATKFAAANRELKEKLVGKEDKVVENIKSKTEGHLQSTLDHIMEVSHSGRHCVLTLAPSDLSSNLRISSLHPIILAMEPHHKTIKLKASGGRIPSGFPQDQLGPSTVQNIRERIRSVRPYVTGEVSVHSPVNVDDLLGQIVDLVVEQQRHVLWELDLP